MGGLNSLPTRMKENVTQVPATVFTMILSDMLGSCSNQRRSEVMLRVYEYVRKQWSSSSTRYEASNTNCSVSKAPPSSSHSVPTPTWPIILSAPQHDRQTVPGIFRLSVPQIRTGQECKSGTEGAFMTSRLNFGLLYQCKGCPGFGSDSRSWLSCLQFSARSGSRWYEAATSVVECCLRRKRILDENIV